METYKLNELDQELLNEAIAVAERLRVPKVQEVGAAVRTVSGDTFAAIHFESAAGYATVCGEQAAIACMIAANHRDLDTVAAVWRDNEGQAYILPPCGRCRETIADLNAETWVIVSADRDHWAPSAIERPVKVRISELLPLKSHTLHQ